MPGEILEIHTPDGRQTFEIGRRPSISIGRHLDNALPIGDTMASRRHCIIERTRGGWQIRDLNSSNGTLLNGSPVQMAPLQAGDVITIGATRITLTVPGAPAIPPRARGSAAVEPSQPEDDVETLSEEDLVDVDESGAESPLHVALAEDTNVFTGDATSCEQALHSLADALPTKPFGQYEIAMMNARGAVVHPAAPPPPGKPRQEAVELLRLLLLVVARSRATDIHMEPKGEFYQLRIRIDGSMVDVGRFGNDIGIKLTALVKILSDIDVTQKSIVQEGHFAARVPGRRVDYRVSFAPSVFGQKLVMRVQDTALAPLRVRDLHLPKWMVEEVEATLKQDQGMVLVCGPTGSGKTTTLYSLIRSSDTARKNFVTIEDPVEIQIDGVTQIPVDEPEGKTFSALLRSVLRQDPDVIMVGEIRDAETARIAMQAAITGHMVFSTVHTTSTVGTIFRLLDLGVEPYLVAQGLHLVLAQRLVRQLCPYCKKAVRPTEEQLARLPNAGEGLRKIYVPAGCARCLNTGYWGRQAFFELLRTTEELRDVIVRTPTMQEVTKALASTRFEKLQQTGFALVAEGSVAFDEIERAVGR